MCMQLLHVHVVPSLKLTFQNLRASNSETNITKFEERLDEMLVIFE